jgi:hypothetical protein
MDNIYRATIEVDQIIIMDNKKNHILSEVITLNK